MNEYNSILCRISEFNNICRGCLKTGGDVKQASEITRLRYKNLLSKIHHTDEQIYLCVICSTIIRKITRFLKQCYEADEQFRKICQLQTKLGYNTYNLPYMRLIQTEITTHDYNPDVADTLSFDDDLKVEYENDFTVDTSDDDVPLVMLKKEEPQLEIVFEPPAVSAKSEDVEHRKRSKKKSRKRNKNNAKADTEPLVDIQDLEGASVDTSSMKEKNKPKRPLREGFTSRMVQETDEYIVIKLTKEQVLEEMVEKAKSERYQRAPYKCEKCVKGFNFEDVLNNHMEKHSLANGTYRCELCSQYCPSPVSMRGHMKSHTTRYRCKVCGEVRLARQHLLEHHAAHAGASASAAYACRQCDFSTCKRTAMQRHARTHAARARLACAACGNLFRSVESLRAHTLRHDASRRYACGECARSFLYPSLLRAHAAAHRAAARDFYCVECDVRFKTRENLKTHFKKSKAHRDPNMLIYPCASCPARFPSAAARRAHAAAAHGARALACAAAGCARRYCSRDALRAHARRHHAPAPAPTPTPTPAHACHVCGKTFTQRAVLARHVRVHTGERPYACAECGLAFAQRATRRTHARLVHRRLPRALQHHEKKNPQIPYEEQAQHDLNQQSTHVQTSEVQ